MDEVPAVANRGVRAMANRGVRATANRGVRAEAVVKVVLVAMGVRRDDGIGVLLAIGMAVVVVVVVMFIRLIDMDAVEIVNRVMDGGMDGRIARIAYFSHYLLCP